MDDARNDATSRIASKKMIDGRDEALSSVTSYENGRHLFERMNDCKIENIDESVSSMDSKFEGRVRDRKRFFEHHIFEQKQRENALISPTLSNSTSPKTSLPRFQDSSDPLLIEERTDSENLLINKNQRFDPETTDSGSLFENDDGRMGPEESFNIFFPKLEFGSGSDIDPSELIELESSYYSSKEHVDPTRISFLENRTESIDLTNPAVSHSHQHKENVENHGNESFSLLNFDDADSEAKRNEENKFSQIGQNVQSGHNPDSPKSSHVPFDKLSCPEEIKVGMGRENKEDCVTQENIEQTKNVDEHVRTNSQASVPIVKIQITNTRTENQNEDIHQIKSERKVDIDEMITEFQNASAQLSGKLTTIPSRNLKAVRRPGNRSNHIETNQEGDVSQIMSRDETHSCDSNLTRKSAINSLICSSESSDCSIDSRNSKGTKSVSSKSAKSIKSLMKLKVKANGMGKIFKKAKKGMGKSVKNLTVKSVSQISQLTSIVKNSMTTKQAKESLVTVEQSLEIIDGIEDETNSGDFFDEKLAEELMNDNKDETTIMKASRYLDSGRRLLRNRVEMKKSNDVRGSKDALRKANTYAYVGRQLARQYLLAYRQELLQEVGITSMNISPAVDDDDFSVFDDFFLSFLQCIGPCGDDEDVENSRLQVEEALEILNNLSEEETNAVKGLLSKQVNGETGLERRVKVQGAVMAACNFNERDDNTREKYTNHDRTLAIHGFISNLQSFYEIDTTIELSKIFLKLNQHKREDGKISMENNTTKSLLSESTSYNYSEPLKFDHGRSFHTRSFTTAGSFKQEQPSSSSSPRRGGRTKEESLAEGIRPGTTVVSISVKNKKFKNKNNSNNKKRQPLSKKWLTGSGRK